MSKICSRILSRRWPEPMSSVSPYDASDKHSAVRSMFSRIAWRYDVMNRIMTGGLDGRWRKLAAQAAALPPGGLALDVGTGTGDLAFTLAESAPGVRVVGVDYTGAMLAPAPSKARRAGLGGRTAWARADGHVLPFADDTFDAVTSAFVLRNFSDLPAAIAEMARVTLPGGKVVALEISPEAAKWWRRIFEPYFRHVVPIVGQVVTGDRGAYEYLPASSAAFLAPTEIAGLMRRVGLWPIPVNELLFGSIAIHVGFKPLLGAPEMVDDS